MKEIGLTKGYVAIVDDEDHDLLSRYSWHPTFSGHIVYAATKIYFRETKTRKHASMHRLIMKPEGALVVDHINHNGLDNRRSNLRLCTRSQNCAYQRKLDPKASSRFRGVSISPRGKWIAHLKSDGKVRGLGTFETEDAAARAYDKAAFAAYGDFAYLNFPSDAQQALIVEYLRCHPLAKVGA